MYVHGIFLLTHVLLEISSGGILSGGILERGDFVRGGFVLGRYCPGDIVLEPMYTAKVFDNIFYHFL